MFTGLIRELGMVAENRRSRLSIRCHDLKLKTGDSVSVNGVCLTVVGQTAGRARIYRFDVSRETLDKTTLGGLAVGSAVNVEPALRVSDALGGHLVQGHVDGVGSVAAIRKADGGAVFWFRAPRAVAPYLVKKGSVTVDGISLTVADLKGSAFSVAIIPHTLAHTTLRDRSAGDRVNLEADIMAKYVSKYLKRRS